MCKVHARIGSKFTMIGFDHIVRTKKVKNNIIAIEASTKEAKSTITL
jgi:hypothetical protein